MCHFSCDVSISLSSALFINMWVLYPVLYVLNDKKQPAFTTIRLTMVVFLLKLETK